jgi:plasmid stabilization system protein ParE
MKPKGLRILSEAREEINEAFDWYFQRNPGAAEAFLAEVRRSFQQIVSHPQLYPAFTKNTRRRVVEGFLYSVIFQMKDGVIVIVAVAHAKRRPGYWNERI